MIDILEQIFVNILSIFCIYAMAYIDYEHISDDDFIENHKSRVFLRTIIAFFFCFINFKFGLIFFFLFAALFDQILNTLNKKDFWYLGDTAELDKFWKKHMTLYKIMKVTSLLIAIALNLI